MTRKAKKKSQFPDIPQATPWHDFEDGWIEPLDTKAARRARRKMILKGRADEKRKGYDVEPLPRHVYVVQADNGLIKIGSAFDIELRFDQIQCASPVPLRLAWWHLNGGIKLEKWLHRHFRHYRSHGEWFRVRLEDVQAIVARLIEGGHLR